MTNNNKDLGGFLSGITYGKRPRPIFCLIHGPDGVGKTTFASHAPEPIFIGTEKGSEQLDVARLPQPQSFGALLNQISGLAKQEHPFKSVVIDSIDWLEPLVWKQVCAEAQVKTIEDYGGGYGKGYTRALEIWRGLLGQLTDLAERFHVILIAHSKIKRFDDPNQLAGYDRYVIAVHDGAAAALRQAVDAVLFATFKERVKQASKSGSGNRGLGDGERVLYTEHRPGFDSKNRFGLPFEMALEWKAFASAVKAFYFNNSGSQQQGGAVVSGSAPADPPHPQVGTTDEQAETGSRKEK